MKTKKCRTEEYVSRSDCPLGIDVHWVRGPVRGPEDVSGVGIPSLHTGGNRSEGGLLQTVRRDFMSERQRRMREPGGTSPNK